MTLLALDIASRTGIALGRPGSAPQAWVEHLGETDDGRFAQALRMTDRLLREHKPDVVAIEAAIGGSRTSHLLVGLVAVVRACCYVRGVPVVTYRVDQIRKHFLSQHITSRGAQFAHLPEHRRKGAARKEAKAAVVSRCKALGWPARNDDEADAMALWDYACSLRSRAHATMTAGPLLDGLPR